MKYINLLIFPFAILLLFACNKEEIIPDFTGCWEEVESGNVQYVGESYTICFLNDTELTLEILKWSDILGHPCEDVDKYVEGIYLWDKKSFEIQGAYTDSTFITSDSDCEGNRYFQRNFKLDVISETEVILNKNEELPTSRIRLLKID